MKKHLPTVLITRPFPQSDEFGEMLGKNVNVISSPILKIKNIDISVDPARYDGIIFTSRNAVVEASQSIELAGLTAIAVGDRTAEMARRFGMSAISAKGAVDDLIPIVIQNHRTQKLLYLHGKHKAGDLNGHLEAAGINVTSIIAYEQLAEPLTSAAQTALCGEQALILPLFSQRSARLLSVAVADLQAKAPIFLIGMSRNIVNAWQGPDPFGSEIAPKTTVSSMAKETLRCIANWA